MLFKKITEPKIHFPVRSENEIKSICNITFIDDDREFCVPKILIDSGWINTRMLQDVKSLDSKEIKNTHIFFVDILGVGKIMNFRSEGLGLILALKDKYPEKKIIVYSAVSEGNMFHKGLSAADERLSKNADPYEFIYYVEKFSKELFSAEEFIEIIKNNLKEVGVYIERKDIIKSLNLIYKKNDYSINNISESFNLQNASSIATITQLFFDILK